MMRPAWDMMKTNSEQAFDEDAARLCDEAMQRCDRDVVRALAWINYEWRSVPDSRESDLQDAVTDMLRQYATPEEWTTWKGYCEGTGAMLYGTAMKAKRAPIAQQRAA